MSSALDGCFIKGTSLALGLDMIAQKGLLPPITAILGEQAIAALRDDAGRAWVPLSRYVPYCEALRNVLGSEAKYIAFWREHIGAMLASPLLKGLAATARALFGLSPAAIFKVTPRGWLLTYKNVGECSSEVVGTKAVLRFSKVPAAVLQSRTFAVGHVGTFSGVIDVFKAKGDGVMTAFEPELGRFTIELEWT